MFMKLYTIRKNLQILICFLIMRSVLIAQEKPVEFTVNQIASIPTFPSPEASPFTNEAKASANYFNGSLNASIPIYTISSRHLSVPVSINYNCNGIKVNDVSTRVGIGWHLNAGGVISRTKYDRPDEKEKRIDLDGVSWDDPESVINAVEYCVDDGDGMNDLFSYSFPGGSGKFAFDLDWNPILVPQKDIKIEIEKDLTVINGFIITGIDGIEYHYYNYETTTNPPLTNSGPWDPDVTTAWYLSKIKHPLNDSIMFYYSHPGTYGYTAGKVYMKSFKYPVSSSNCFCGTGYSFEVYDQMISINPCRLDSIVFVSGTVFFTYEDIGQIIPKQKLSSISIFNKADEELCSYQLSHSVYGERLLLDSVVKTSNNEEFPPYRFGYINKNAMPNRLITAQDEFGFYNGKHSNITLLTRKSGEYFGIFEGEPIADRSHSFSHASIGILRKITYPTSGFSIIDYEPHRSNEEIYITYYNHKIIGPLSISNSPPNYIGTLDTTFVLSEEGYICLTMKIEINNHEHDSKACFTIDDHDEICLECPEELTCYDTAIIYLDEGEHILLIEAVGHADQTICTATAKIYLQEIDSIPIYPEYGIRVKRITDNFGDASSPVIRRIYYAPFQDTLSSSLLPVFPPRYFNENKHYMECTPSNTFVCPSIIWYANSINPLLPYGNDFVYNTVTLSYGENFNNGGIQYSFIARRNSAGQILIPPNELADGSQNQHSWINGTITSTITFDNVLNRVKSVVNDYAEFNGASINNYDIRQICSGFTGSTNYEERLLDYAAERSQYHSLWLRLDEVIDTDYFPASNTSITKTTQFFYDDPISKLVTKEIITESKGERIKEAFYPTMYSGTGTGAAAAIHLMKEDKHIHDKAIEIVESVNYPNSPEPCITSSQANFYKVVEDKIIPDKIYKLETESPVPQSQYQYSSILNGQFNYDESFKEQIIYDLIDEFGNLRQYHEVNNYPVSFVWGYNNTFPVARIENATFSEVESNLGCTYVQLQQKTDTELMSIMDNLRIALPNTFITSYTYDPLIGTTSETDPNGITINYKYDDFRRLETIKDHDNNIIKHIDYHYIEQ